MYYIRTAFYSTFSGFNTNLKTFLYEMFGMTQSSLVPNLSFFLNLICINISLGHDIS